MKKIVFIIICMALMSCTSFKQELQSKERYDRLSKGFTIRSLPNWTFHGYHDIFNLTPNDLMNKGKEYIGNYVSAYKYRKSSNAPLDSIVENDFKRMYSTEVINPKKYTASTKYGESIVVTYQAKHGTYEYQCVRQFYKYKDYVYKVSYVAKKQYFDTYYNDAIVIMKTFTITE